MPDIVIVGVEGLKETKMTVPHEVVRQGMTNRRLKNFGLAR